VLSEIFRKKNYKKEYTITHFNSTLVVTSFYAKDIILYSKIGDFAF
jgi:hypothetical protein